MSSLYNEVRPKKFSDVVGQDAVIAKLKSQGKAGKIPHAMLFHGPSGTGKTTLAMIVASALGCRGLDLQVINAAATRGIDTVRSLLAGANAAPLYGKCRVIIFDEAHRLTPEALDALLLATENPPPLMYFVMCTTDFNKLSKTIKTRFSPYKLNPIRDRDLVQIMQQACEKKKWKLSKKVLTQIALSSDQSARLALVVLEQVAELETESEILDAIEPAIKDTPGYQIFRTMMDGRASWDQARKVLTAIKETEEPESLRYMVLACADKALLDPKSSEEKQDRAADIIEEFRFSIVESKWAGFDLAVFNVFNPKSHD